jgi:hypothetical protein
VFSDNEQGGIMNIVILSIADYAGSGFKMSQAISKYHNVQLYAGMGSNVFDIDTMAKPISSAQPDIDKADIVHLKGDWPPSSYEQIGLKISHKPIVQTVGGSFFRKVKYGGLGRFKAKDYETCALRTSLTPDLLYPEYKGILTPHAIDCLGVSNTFKNGDIITHIPSNTSKKGTEFIENVIRLISRTFDVKYYRHTDIQHKDSVSIKSESFMYFDQFVVGAYGNAAIEAMQFGIPTACYLSKMSIEQADGLFDDCPIITADLRTRDWYYKLKDVLNSDVSGLSKRTKEWCDKNHSYEAVGRMWDKLYRTL